MDLDGTVRIYFKTYDGVEGTADIPAKINVTKTNDMRIKSGTPMTIHTWQGMDVTLSE